MNKKAILTFLVPLLTLAGCNDGSPSAQTSTVNDNELDSDFPQPEYLAWEMPEPTQKLDVIPSETLSEKSNLMYRSSILPHELQVGEVYEIKGKTGDKIVLSVPEAHFTLWVNGITFDKTIGLEDNMFFGLESEVLEVEDGTYQFAMASSGDGLDSGSDFWHQVIVGNLTSEFTFIAWDESEQTESFDTVYTGASFDLRLEVRELPAVSSEPWSGNWQVTRDLTNTGGDTECTNSYEEYTRDIRVAFGQWFESNGNNIWEWDTSIEVNDTDMAFHNFSTLSNYNESDTPETRKETEEQGTGTANTSSFAINGTIKDKTINFLNNEATVECQYQFSETGYR